MTEITGIQSNEHKDKPKVEGYDSNGVSLYYRSVRQNPIYPTETISTLRLGNAGELAISRDRIAYGRTHGLEQYIRTETREGRVPTYIFDNHNHAFFAWCEALKEGKIQKGVTLIHIDTHGDEGIFDGSTIDINDLRAVTEHTEKLKIYDFISSGLNQGIISDVIWVSPNETRNTLEGHNVKGMIPYKLTSINSPELIRFRNGAIDPKKIIVDIDLDYFERPLTHSKHFQQEDAEERVRKDLQIVKNLANKAGVVSMVTSPGFIDQTVAITLAKEIAK